MCWTVFFGVLVVLLVLLAWITTVTSFIRGSLKGQLRLNIEGVIKYYKQRVKESGRHGNVILGT